ncbi:hypothetical protein T05_8997 [Trichinella murrelli]|uniref:Uncharacterized protein n=1 Tax=Trichinella murrelli TaxID=144512 RepID=A0A0V0U8M1_9BILA|nr:hypothetical protein T05_8997 [Trichinella murrelli]
MAWTTLIAPVIKDDRSIRIFGDYMHCGKICIKKEGLLQTLIWYRHITSYWSISFGFIMPRRNRLSARHCQRFLDTLLVHLDVVVPNKRNV